MGWKNWSYAKRGAIVGGVIGIIVDIIIIVLTWDIVQTKGTDAEIAVFCWTQLIIPCFVAGWVHSLNKDYSIYILGLITWFLFGTLIGFIIGKIKSRNK